MKKYTQGPWQFIEESTQICGADGETVFFETGSATPEDCRLAAAAPELFEALSETLIYLPEHPEDRSLREAVCKARAAIAKAAG